MQTQDVLVGEKPCAVIAHRTHEHPLDVVAGKLAGYPARPAKRRLIEPLPDPPIGGRYGDIILE
jgi:hypothetical protein